MGLENSGRRASTVETRQRLDPDDIPRRPSNLDQHAREHWASVIATVPHLTASDTDLAVECCRMYSLYRRAIASCELIPLDDEAANTAQKYFNQWQGIFKKLGLDPVSRAKLDKQYCRTPPEEETVESKFFGVVG